MAPPFVPGIARVPVAAPPLTRLESPIEEVVARRAGRIAFGVVLIAGAAALINRELLGIHAAPLLLGTWLLAFTAAAIARAVLPLRGPHGPDSLFAASIAVPSIGVALMLPLLIHLPFVIGGDARDFDSWVAMSLIFAGPTHLALAYMAARRGARLAAGLPAQSAGSVYLIGLCVACVPFVVLVIPVIIIAFTGLPMLLLLGYQERLVARERIEVGADLPRAFLHAA